MAALYQVLIVLLTLSVFGNARPTATEIGSPDNLESTNLENSDPSENVEAAAAETPQVYLIIAETSEDDPKIIATPLAEDEIEKRSAEEVDDLETAAGTNVLRPLFVYRQQLAYRERVKKGAGFRRSGFRPGFQ